MTAPLALLLTLIGTAQAATDMAWPIRLRQDMARVMQQEWQLRQAAGSLCPTSARDSGVLFDDRRAYAANDWPLLARTLGMGARPVVAAIAAGGPADRAGLQPGDEVVAIAGQMVEAIATRRKAGALVGEALLDEIAEAPGDQPIAFDVLRAGKPLHIQVRPVRHCAARLVLVTDRGVDAHSDARNVAISTGLVTFARSDDEIALAAGHELAHIILRHRKGGGISARRSMEDDADSLGLRLMHCAGYDATKGLGLFQRLGKGDWLGFLRAPTHRSFAKRVARLQAEVPGLTCPVSAASLHRG
nr:M48 family metallopeptidase [Novosphingobium jiangmenense]